MSTEPHDLYRKIEPVSRVFRALGIPPIETVLPTPAEVIEDLGIPTIEDLLEPIKDEIRGKIKTLR